MKIPFIAIALGFLAGCNGASHVRATSQSSVHPVGTDVGASFPGVNQPTNTTTATASSDSR